MCQSCRNTRNLQIEIPDVMIKICIIEINGVYTIKWELKDLEDGSISLIGECCINPTRGEIKYCMHPPDPDGETAPRTDLIGQENVLFHLEEMRQNFFTGRCSKYSEQHHLFEEYRDLLDKVIATLRNSPWGFRTCVAG